MTISASMRRIAALTALVFFAAVFWALIGARAFEVALHAFRGDEDAQKRAEVYKRVIDEEPQWKSFMDDVQNGKYRTLFVMGSEPNVAAAQLQADIKQIIEAAGGMLQSIQVLPAVQEKDLTRLNIRASFTLPAAALTTFLMQIEHGSRTVYLDHLQLSAPETPAPQEPGKKEPLQLTAQIDFSAYFLAEVP
jgi:hypothetical protein